MPWEVVFGEEFDKEFGALTQPVQDEMLASAKLLGVRPAAWPAARRYTERLVVREHKELRFDADGGVWRMAFAFDPERKAVLLVAGDKSGGSEKRFYKRLIARADERYQHHLDRTAAAKREQK